MAEKDIGYIDFEDWYNSFYKNNCLIVFKGDFKQDLIISIVKLVEEMRDLAQENYSIRKRIYSIIVECLQNVCRHGEKLENGNPMAPGILVLRKEDGAYIISSGNLVLSSKINSLKGYLDKVKCMGVHDLIKFQKEVLINTELYGKYGADLGLINISLMSSSKFQYDFCKMNDKHSFFSFEVTLSKKEIR